MSQTSALRELDAILVETLAESGLADAATYTPPGAGSPVTCTVVVDRNVEAFGEDESGAEVAMYVTTIAIFRAEVNDPSRGGTITLTETSEVLKLGKLQRRDESRTVWIAAE